MDCQGAGRAGRDKRKHPHGLRISVASAYVWGNHGRTRSSVCELSASRPRYDQRPRGTYQKQVVRSRAPSRYDQPTIRSDGRRRHNMFRAPLPAQFRASQVTMALATALGLGCFRSPNLHMRLQDRETPQLVWFRLPTPAKSVARGRLLYVRPETDVRMYLSVYVDMWMCIFDRERTPSVQASQHPPHPHPAAYHPRAVFNRAVRRLAIASVHGLEIRDNSDRSVKRG